MTGKPTQASAYRWVVLFVFSIIKAASLILTSQVHETGPDQVKCRIPVR